MSTLFEYLLWVDPFWGRCNMGAIELSEPLFILVDFRALSAIIRKYMHISYWDLNDYARNTGNTRDTRTFSPFLQLEKRV